MNITDLMCVSEADIATDHSYIFRLGEMELTVGRGCQNAAV